MKQEQALQLLKSGKNVFLTGSAGTGKTYVLNTFINHLKAAGVPVAVTASTGIAATHLNGLTIHSWSGIGVKEQLTSADLKRMKEKKYLQKSLENTAVLIVDEISMLHRRQLELVDEVLRYFRKSDDPFGGIQVVLCGDFFQLPPVSEYTEENHQRFAFMSPLWGKACFTVCYLTEQYRQNDNELHRILNEIRNGSVSNQSVLTLEKTQQNEPIGKITRLFTHNADVDRLNLEQLKTLETRQVEFKARKKGNPNLLELLKKSVLTYENLPLKTGAVVMFVKNNYDQGYMNGSMGEVVAFSEDEGLPLVKLNDGRVIMAEEQVWSVDDEKGKPLATFTQVPLRLAWAITVHKSQGMTLDAAEIDLGKTFERGQGYVALSRLKDLEGLRLTSLNVRALETDALVKKADRRFIELSNEAENSYDSNILEQLAEAFVLQYSREEYKKKAKAAKIDTYDKTLEGVRKGLTLEKIAKDRGLSPNTVAGHLLTLKKRYPDLNLDLYKPANEVIALVGKVVNKILAENNADDFSKNGEIKLGVLYGRLRGKIEYDDLRLALLFI